MSYKERKAAAIYRPTKPTKTDQSQAKDTDVNLIVKRFTVSGTAPGTSAQPMYGDFSILPKDLREMIEQVRGIEKLRKGLPRNMQNLTLQDIVELDNQALERYLLPTPTPGASKETKE